MKPVILAQLDERPLVAVLPDGALLGFHVSREADIQEVRVRSSRDTGVNWSKPEGVFTLPEPIAPAEVAPPQRVADTGSPGGSMPVGAVDDSSQTDPIGRWGGCQVLVDAEGEIHLFLLNDRGTGVFADPSGEGEIKRMGLHDRRLDIWHLRSEEDRQRWRSPQRIWTGYTGSLNSVIQTRAGRIILPFAALTHRTWRDRGEGLDAFWFAGTSSTTALYSDDGGDSWQKSPAKLKVQTPSIGTYGAVEPVVLELRDGRVWMLIRTQLGRLYESFSKNGGSNWSPPRPTRLISSDSPVGLVRLPDDRIVLLWNKCLRFPYAHGGRQVLHAAISEDEGRTWIGQREVARDPLRNEPPPPGGDHGTAYPFPALLPDGRVLVTTGQGKGRVVLIAVDPEWLYERNQETNFEEGLEGWEVFGCRGVELKEHPEREEIQLLSIARIDEEWPAAAVWNFPSASRGRLTVKLCLQAESGGALLLLSDHFSVPFDPEDALHALFRLEIGADGTLAGGDKLEVGSWHELTLRWDCEKRNCEVMVDERPTAELPLLQESEGACYLRLRSAAEGKKQGGLLVEKVAVKIER